MLLYADYVLITCLHAVACRSSWCGISGLGCIFAALTLTMFLHACPACLPVLFLQEQLVQHQRAWCIFAAVTLTMILYAGPAYCHVVLQEQLVQREHKKEGKRARKRERELMVQAGLRPAPGQEGTNIAGGHEVL